MLIVFQGDRNIIEDYKYISTHSISGKFKFRETIYFSSFRDYWYSENGMQHNLSGTQGRSDSQSDSITHFSPLAKSYWILQRIGNSFFGYVFHSFLSRYCVVTQSHFLKRYSQVKFRRWVTEAMLLLTLYQVFHCILHPGRDI